LRAASESEAPPVAVDVAPDGSRIVRVGAWVLAAPAAEDEPRIRDIDLAERLGYERPRKIRDLIERLCREGKLNDSELRPVVGRSGGRPAKAAIEIRQRESGVLAPERVNAIKARAASCASDLAKFGVEKRRAASLRIHKRLKMRVGWYGDRCRLDNMPARGAIASSRQRTLFAVPANVNRARPSA
jgi:hypothetical protein